MEKKRYSVGCTAPEDWQYIHEVLTQDGTLEDNIPSREIEVDDIKSHSPTRAVYLLTDDDSNNIKRSFMTITPHLHNIFPYNSKGFRRYFETQKNRLEAWQT